MDQTADQAARGPVATKTPTFGEFLGVLAARDRRAEPVAGNPRHLRLRGPPLSRSRPGRASGSIGCRYGTCRPGSTRWAKTCQCCAQGKDARRRPDRRKCCATRHAAARTSRQPTRSAHIRRVLRTVLSQAETEGLISSERREGDPAASHPQTQTSSLDRRRSPQVPGVGPNRRRPALRRLRPGPRPRPPQRRAARPRLGRDRPRRRHGHDRLANPAGRQGPRHRASPDQDQLVRCHPPAAANLRGRAPRASPGARAPRRKGRRGLARVRPGLLHPIRDADRAAQLPPLLGSPGDRRRRSRTSRFTTPAAPAERCSPISTCIHAWRCRSSGTRTSRSRWRSTPRSPTIRLGRRSRSSARVLINEPLLYFAAVLGLETR